MSPIAIKEVVSELGNAKSGDSEENRRRFANLRGVRWRIDLGILPSSSSSIDDLRRVTADCRRSYAGLRRRLLIDPHILWDETSSQNLVIDNPLSQNPDSTWGRFFRNAELEKTVDQDLSRLYPEHGSYFQTPGCQGMLRRILLLWCLRHPEFGYRQGMHELLAPLSYVLHVDVQHLSEVRKQYGDHFIDKFDGLSFHENDIMYNIEFKKVLGSMEDEAGSHSNAIKVKSFDELDPEIRTIVLLSDAYGVEGELGIVLSEKFLEHDTYCMFDALMSGAHGSVAMAEFFSTSPAIISHSGLPPVIEASASLYQLLSLVDSSLHSHLVELGVEPQYFSLRWLRVLFGREFSLENLLLIWDEIFAEDNKKLEKPIKDDTNSCFGILCSPRGALISAMAVSMMLYLRSSLLATENATICLQRLLNFPKDVDLRKLIGKANSLQSLALETNSLTSISTSDRIFNQNKSSMGRGHRHTLSSDNISPKTPLKLLPESYWEEKWRVLQNPEEVKHSSSSRKQNSDQKRGWSERVRLGLSRTESDPAPIKAGSSKEQSSSVHHRLLEDLSHELGLDEDMERIDCREVSEQKPPELKVNEDDALSKDFSSSTEERCLDGNSASEENSVATSSDPSSPFHDANDDQNHLEKGSATLSSSNENDDLSKVAAEVVNACIDDGSPNDGSSNGHNAKIPTAPKEKKGISGRIQWLWKFGRNGADEASKNTTGSQDVMESDNASMNMSKKTVSSSSDVSCNSFSGEKADTLDQNVIGTLKNLGNSMLEHIQVIESVFQQDPVPVASLENLSKNVIVGKGQVTAMTALKELRKISNILSEM